MNPGSTHGHSISLSSLSGYAGPAHQNGALRSGSISSSIHNPTSSVGHANGSDAVANAVVRKTYPTAEEEKAAMRYYEAKRAVDRRQGELEADDAPREGPISYDVLYPTTSMPLNSPGILNYTSNGFAPHSLSQLDGGSPVVTNTIAVCHCFLRGLLF